MEQSMTTEESNCAQVQSCHDTLTHNLQ